MARSRHDADSHADRRDLARTLALAFGVIYLLVGIAGFFVTGFENFAEETGDKLIIFEVNPLHNIVHLIVGIAGIALSRTRAGARTYGLLLAVAYGATFVYGLFAVNEEDVNFLSINNADNVLHLVSALAGVVIVALASKDPAGRPGTARA